MKTTKVFLWSSPRNVSTALMYAFAERQDCKVYDEPLYAYYLSKTEARDYHPAAEEILNTMEKNGEKVVEFMLDSTDASVQFFKNMTHHLIGLNREFMKEGKNVILTRNPREMILSYSKVIPHPEMKDVGYLQQYELIKELQSQGIPLVVLDSKRLLLNPRKQLKKLCDFLQITFSEEMLSWKPGKREEDGVWAPHWYDNVHTSTGFMEYRERKGEVKPELRPLLEECNKYYERIMEYAL